MLTVEHLNKIYKSGFISHSNLHAVRDVSFQLQGDEIMGILGESGCGKTTLGKMLVRLVEPTSGRISIKDTDITKLFGKELYDYWPKLQMIFQDPRSSLNPRMKVGDSLIEGLKLSGNGAIKDTTIQSILEKVNIREEILCRYPHEVSGGEIQRIVIARALSAKPAIIVADEPTSNLDLSVQAQILNLLKKIHLEFKVPSILISHDIDVVKWMCDRVAVMFQGKIIEEGVVDDVMNNPLHPYTCALFGVLGDGERIIDTPPLSHSDFHQPSKTGCPYAERCEYARDQCFQYDVPLIGNGHKVACHRVISKDN